MTTQQLNGKVANLQDTKSLFLEITNQKSATKNAVNEFCNLLQSDRELNDTAKLKFLELAKFINKANFAKTDTWQKINKSLIEILDNSKIKEVEKNNEDQDISAVNDSDINDSDINDSDINEDDDLTDESIIESNDNSDRDLTKQEVADSWLDLVDVVDWDNTNIQNNQKLTDRSVIALDGQYFQNARAKVKLANTEQIVSFNYGVGQVLITVDFTKYFVLGTIDKKQFIPSLDTDLHDFMLNSTSIVKSPNIELYRKAVLLINKYYVRENTKNTAKEKLAKKLAAKKVTTSLDQALITATNRRI